MKKVLTFTALALGGMSVATSVKAEEPEKAVTLSVGADLVSSYVWRGQECAGVSIQPEATLTFNKANITFGVWGSAPLVEKENSFNMGECDLSLSWNPIEALSIGFTDYYFCTGNFLSAWNFSSDASHNLELNLGYDFKFLALSWNTCLTGPDHDGDGNRNYGTYIELSAPWKLSGLDGSFAIGARPWSDAFTNAKDGNSKFHVCNIALTANKELFHLPFMGQLVVNPQSDNIYFVAGVTF